MTLKSVLHLLNSLRALPLNKPFAMRHGVGRIMRGGCVESCPAAAAPTEAADDGDALGAPFVRSLPASPVRAAHIDDVDSVEGPRSALLRTSLRLIMIVLIDAGISVLLPLLLPVLDSISFFSNIFGCTTAVRASSRRAIVTGADGEWPRRASS